MDVQEEQHKHMIELAFTKMPFGKYQGRYLSDIPEPYYVWFKQKGFPNNKLGRMLEEMYEIKVNGLEHIFRKIRQTSSPSR